MAASTISGDAVATPSLLATRRALGWGLIWAALMLVVLDFWFAQTEMDLRTIILIVIGGLAAAALVLGIRVLITNPVRGVPPEASPAPLLKERRRLALAFFAWSAVLLILGLLVGFQLGLAGFGQAAALVVLALIGAGTAVFLSMPPAAGPGRERVMSWLLEHRGLVTSVLLGTAVVCGILAVWAYNVAGPGPDVGGAALLAVLFLGVGLWQALLLEGQANTQTMRLLVLVTGGAFGLIVAVVTVWRAWWWWRDGLIFTRDVPMAESPGLWRLWLAAYVEVLGLGILFGSLMLGRADIRQNPLMRRLLFGYNAVLTGLLLLVTLVLLNVVVYVTYPYTVEWTASLGLHSLSPSSKNLLQSLKEPVRVYALVPQNSQIYKELRPLLENAQAYTRMLQVEYVSPDRDDVRYQKLVQKFPVVLREAAQFGMERQAVGRGVLLVYGPEEAGKPPHAFINQSEMTDSKDEREGRRKVIFKGEDVIMSQLRLLAEREKKPKIYFTQSNDELDLSDALTQFQTAADKRGGAGLLLQRLKKDNYDVRGLLWEPPPRKGKVSDLFVFSQADPKDPHEVPADASLVIIAHPLQPFTKDVIAALERYLDQRGGKLIVLTNLLRGRDQRAADLNLGGLLQKYNVKLGDDFLIRFTLEQDPLTVIATPPEHSRNRVAENFRTSRFPVGGMFVGKSVGIARSVRSQAPTGAYEVQTLLEVDPKLNGAFWAESDLNVLRNLGGYLQNLALEDKVEDRKSKDPIPVAVGVVDRGGKPRLAVFGDARFASNLFVRGPAPYYDFLTSTIEWLAERPENMGIRPRESTSYTIQPEAVNTQRLIWLPLGLVVLFFAGLGLGIWVVRRR